MNVRQETERGQAAGERERKQRHTVRVGPAHDAEEREWPLQADLIRIRGAFAGGPVTGSAGPPSGIIQVVVERQRE